MLLSLLSNYFSTFNLIISTLLSFFVFVKVELKMSTKQLKIVVNYSPCDDVFRQIVT